MSPSQMLAHDGHPVNTSSKQAPALGLDCLQRGPALVAFRGDDFQKSLPCADSGRTGYFPSSSWWSLRKQTTAAETCACPLGEATVLQSRASVCLVPREISVQESGDQSRNEKKGCPHHQRPKAPPTPLHQILSQPSTGQAQEKLMDTYHGQITHLRKKCCYRWASPHEIMPGTL